MRQLIKQNIYIGNYPRNEVDVDRLKSGPEISAVLNLQTNDDFQARRVNWPEIEQAYEARDMLCQRWPIVDFSPNNLENRLEGAVDALARLLDDGHRVYVHCTAGQRRAPAVVIGYLAWNQGMGVKASFKLVRRLRRCSPYMDSVFLVHIDRTLNA